MRLATIRTVEGTRAVRVDAGTFIDLGFSDLGLLLQQPDWRERALESGPVVQSLGFAPVVQRPGKVICVGVNYETHIREMGRDIPAHPTLFAKYPEALIGADDDIQMPPESEKVDWEAELAVVIGRSVRRADTAAAEAAIAGFAVLNDVTMRDWQYRTLMWLQGKTWERSTPFGPVLVTPDEVPGGVRPTVAIRSIVDGEVMQESNTGDLVFDPVRLIEYVSTIITLNPGDVIATGTPGGVGHARKPERYLAAGQVLVTEIEGLGRSSARLVAEQVRP